MSPAVHPSIAPPPQRVDVVLRRVPAGWQVETPDAIHETEEDLTLAMSLADLLAGPVPPGTPPAKPAGDSDEVGKLRVQVAQLEHALAARVLVEQAIGVLAERQATPPREAFEKLRRTARGRGQKVFDLARAVVASAHGGPLEGLPPELRKR